MTTIASKTTDLLFVYGTLKRGHGNNPLLRTSTFMGEAISADKNYVLEGLHLIDLPKGHDIAPVKGDLYQVDAHGTWLRLDRLEGHPRIWRREIRPFITEAGKRVDAWVYVYQMAEVPNRPENLPRNDAGQWEYAPGHSRDALGLRYLDGQFDF